MALTLSALAYAEGRRELSFQDALKVTLAHNGDISVSQVDTQIAGDELALADSIYDPRLVATARGSKDNELGTPARLAFTDRIFAASVELAGRLTTGATYSLGFSASNEKYFSPFVSVFNPAYMTQLSLSVTQPLLRGGGRDANNLPIVVAGLRRDLSQQQLRVRLEQVVGDLEIAYWGLALAFKERDARQSSLKLAQDQLAESTRLVKLGSISDLDVVEAHAGVGRTQQELLRAEQQITEAEGKLRQVSIGDPSWNPDDVLVPTDDPAITHIDYAPEPHLKLAREHRPDVIAARAELQAERAAQGVTENGMMPQLDVIMTGGLIGFAGELDPNSGTSAAFGPNFMPDPDALGGVGQALKNLVVHGNYIVSLGLRLELPLVNSAAHARNERQAHATSRAQIAQQSLLLQIDNEVRNSLALLGEGEKLEQAADDAVTIDMQLLAGMRKRFSSGAATSFDVLRVADQLVRAQIEAARARVNYRVSLTRLGLADGTLLERYNISLASPAR
jgi:outer membrane protein